MDSRKSRAALLSLRSVNYSRLGRPILHNINFDLFGGEIHAIVGEHRAGKTPLTQIIAGEVKRDSGVLMIHGSPVEHHSPGESIAHRIGVVHQESQVLPNLTAVGNIIAGTMPPGRITTKYYAEQVKRARQIFTSLGRIPPLDCPLWNLPSTDLPLVEIARLIYLDCNIIVLDDIGMRLTPAEMKTVLRFLRRFRDEGKGVLFIDSDVDNVLAIADRVTFLHEGFISGTENARDLDRLKLLTLTYNFALNIKDESDDPRLVMRKDYDESVIADLPAGVLVFNLDGSLHTANRAARKVLDMNRSPESLSAEDLVGPLVLSEGDSLLDAIQTGAPQNWDRMLLGDDRLVRVRTFPYRDADRTVRGSVVLLEDVTSDDAIKEYLVRAEKISSVAQLAAGVSHEINNPLGIIANYLHTLRGKALEADVRDKVDRIGIQLERIQEITSSLLSFSRIKGPPEGELDLSSLLREVLTLLNHRIKKKSVTVRSALPDVLTIRGSGNRLRQVFVNLISNAVEAVSEGGHLEVAVREVSPYVEVSIRDDGVGIPPDVRSEIFTPFFSTKMTKDNAGLGLSICQHIVEAHKGMITFESKPGTYTVFRVRLPA